MGTVLKKSSPEAKEMGELLRQGHVKAGSLGRAAEMTEIQRKKKKPKKHHQKKNTFLDSCLPQSVYHLSP